MAPGSPKYFVTFCAVIPGNVARKPIFIAASKVDLVGEKSDAYTFLTSLVIGCLCRATNALCCTGCAGGSVKLVVAPSDSGSIHSLVPG